MHPLKHVRQITPHELACCTEYVQIQTKDINTYLAQGWHCVSYSYGFSNNGIYGERYSLVR